MANDYIGGEGAAFYDRDTFRDEWMEQKIGTKEATKSLIAWSMGSKWQASKPDKMPEAIDLLGAFPASAAGQTLASERHFPDANLLEDILTLQQLRPARDAEAELYLKSMLPLNTVMFRGHTLRRNTKSSTASQKEWKVTEIGRGHWGSNICKSFCFAECPPCVCLTFASALSLFFYRPGLREPSRGDVRGRVPAAAEHQADGFLSRARGRGAHGGTHRGIFRRTRGAHTHTHTHTHTHYNTTCLLRAIHIHTSKKT